MMTERTDKNPVSCADQVTQARLAAIEDHMQHLETLLSSIRRFNNRLDQIHATLELAIGLLTPGQHAGQASEPTPTDEDTDSAQARFRVIAHLNRHGHRTQLAHDVSWPDMWSVRLFVTGLLRNLARSGPITSGVRCWCEVWTPDETGELVDSAFLDPQTGAIDWESDLRNEDEAP